MIHIDNVFPLRHQQESAKYKNLGLGTFTISGVNRIHSFNYGLDVMCSFGNQCDIA